MNISEVIGVKEAYDGWVYIWWIRPGERTMAFARAFHKLEEELRAVKMKGWLTSSQLEHVGMHAQIRKHGGVAYHNDDKFLYFKKELTHV